MRSTISFCTIRADSPFYRFRVIGRNGRCRNFCRETNSTTFDSLEHSVDIIRGIRLNLAGVVVNQYELNRLHRGYYHLHGEYYYQQKYTPKEKT